MARLAQRDQRTVNYMQRRSAEGLSKRDIIRCLKRYIAREIYRVITNPPAPAPTGQEIRAMRKDAGLTQADLAKATGLPLMNISRIERGQLRRGELQHRCHHALTTLPPRA